ncbi:MAG: guanylate kinase [Clostridiales Family XIII bacterium]|jgi:guanylate kinase|nr:guanylate kinase [Clostridiales Family XIII bacterium]
MSYGRQNGDTVKKGRLFVISGPSGTGKGTICKRLTDIADAKLSVSMTTRAPRPGERDGINYYFVEESRFREVLDAGGFLEHAEVYNCLYGTPKQPVFEHLNAGRDVILEIDIQGALRVRERCPEGVFIFVLPPSMSELRKRIVGRGSETEESVNLRMGETLKEISCIDKYDYCVVNGVLDDAVNRIAAIMTAEHSRVDADVAELLERYRNEEAALQGDAPTKGDR